MGLQSIGRDWTIRTIETISKIGQIRRNWKHVWRTIRTIRVCLLGDAGYTIRKPNKARDIITTDKNSRKSKQFLKNLDVSFQSCLPNYSLVFVF